MDPQTRKGIGVALLALAAEAFLTLMDLRGWTIPTGGFWFLTVVFTLLFLYGLWLIFTNPTKATVRHVSEPWTLHKRDYVALGFEAGLHVKGGRTQIEFVLRMPDGYKLDGTLYQRSLRDPFFMFNKDPGKNMLAQGFIDNPKVFDPGIRDPFRLAFLFDPAAYKGSHPLPLVGLVLECWETTPKLRFLCEHKMPDFPDFPPIPTIGPELAKLLGLERDNDA
jgi:hypothetical protein